MEAIQTLLEWATSRGVQVNGIAPKPLPGRGIGIVATRHLKPNETILSVPTPLLRTIGNTPAHIKEALHGASVHAILAVSLCLESEPEFEIWRAVLPSRSDLVPTLPLTWSDSLQALLPPAAKSVLEKQRANFLRDWTVVHGQYQDSIEHDDFLYAWVLVNTRTFYHTTPKTAKDLPREDHMALQPVADLFNHSPSGCKVAYNPKGFTITTTSETFIDGELFIQYGYHGNDFLLVEYGFILPPLLNPCDETNLDEYICPLFDEAERTTLKSAGFWGNYNLDSETECYRTQTVLRFRCLSEREWQAILEGRLDEDTKSDLVERELYRVLEKCSEDIKKRLKGVESLDEEGETVKIETLKQRWEQIQTLVETRMQKTNAQ